MSGVFLSVLTRELRLALRQGGDSLMVVAFFVVTVVLFPFGVGPEPAVLERISAGVLWVTALLASMLSLDRLFQQDYEDGSLDLLVRSSAPLSAVVIAKVAAHWLTSALPLIAAAPLLAVLLQMRGDGFAVLMAAMALGTPSLSLIGAVGAALVLGARRGGVLVSLLILPLSVPILIFGVSAVDAAVMGLSYAAQLKVLAAILLVTLALCPFATALALRQAVE
ncbi:heme exporter protein CcmB [Rhodospirillum rubrum]|uniref:Heme exporter protein B n=1 Tax=Rhodospirillum rubrum (strain ATCC 11170 / ATH 1.1.1 / DSM 467 / LMG 4362 / NCIMB 8255 / S1) TaxID=269796 RepID=Q2RYF1_RHORT|nr:heme exporter protein CcmB [Rhodospirillum rubrum]ABC20844.1 Cytochrome c-type biogenesis protein CcmB [Rhodospirillum rubrum ATCC 11170]AEO46511.1 cytochrome c-type biogenesis protein CcmB [Rhodospirillum rubrum F11]MBK5952400.1 heme exporter protein CcmB [Rhodospirillum rubrum]QXG80547.1 heme exporter protein CcmB [Rhodospirillum rubrum]HAP99685.1 heme exporter protein CcmB [Rhodospirillum rubrum]